MRLVPTTITQAKAFIGQHHRHHQPPVGALFAVGVEAGGELVGVATVGRPVARNLCDGKTAEVTRLCTLGHPNACSMLYAAAWRACRALGYERLLTYILESEPGTSLRSAGWRLIGQAGGSSWSRAERPRIDKHPICKKQRWEAPNNGV